MSELVPQAVRDLLAFYTEKCAEVRFGDLDLRVLQRAVESIDEAAQRVIAAEEAVAEARAQFREVESGLLVKANRTLSFLRIFVDDDVEMQAKLEAIGSGLPGGRRKSKVAGGAAGAGEPRQRRARKGKNADDVEGGSESKDEQAIEAALEKAGIIDDEPSDVELSEPEHEVVPAAAPLGKKSGSKPGK